MQNHEQPMIGDELLTDATLVSKRIQRGWKRTGMKRARQWLIGCILSGTMVAPVMAQQGNRPGTNPPKNPPGNTGGAKPSDNRKLSDAERKREKAREIFADAANAQNNGAFPLAIELWTKLLKDYPDDSLASSARHFLGVCYLQQDTPNFELAIQQFREALKDNDLKQREETLVNLGWGLYQQAAQADGERRKELFAESSKVLTAFIDKYPDGSFADKALFYAAEAESRLGNTERAISLYSQLLQTRALDNSAVRPDAMFGLGLTYDEIRQTQLAKENYEAFLAKYSEHPLSRDVCLRLAEIELKADRPEPAIKLFERIIGSKDFTKTSTADYVLYRYGFALAKVGKFNESAEAYKKLSTLFPKSQYSENSSLAAGQTLMRDKKYGEATQYFQRLLGHKDERAAEAAHWICQIAILQSKAADAVPVARDALTWGSKSASAVLLRMDLADGLNATADGRAEARKLYEQIAVEHPDSPVASRATYNAAFAALQSSAPADAQRWSESFARRFPNDPLASDVAYVRAEATLQLGQHESAATAFEQLINAEKDNPMRSNWEIRLATARFLSGQLDMALEQTSATLRTVQDPAMKAEALFLQGACWVKQQKYDQAIEALSKSIQTNSTWFQSDEVLLLLAEAQTAKGLKDDAKRSLERILKDFPKTRFKSQVEFRLGQISANAGDYDRAVSYYDAVLKSSSDNSLTDFASYGKAFVLIQKEQYDKALTLLTPLTTGNRDDSIACESRIAKAICLRSLNRAAEAIESLKSLPVQKMTPDQTAKMLYELGLSYSAANQFEPAIIALQKLIDDHPKFSLMDKALYEQAWATKSMGNIEKANQLFQTLAEKYPDSPIAAEAYFHVGQAEYDRSKFDKAIKAYTVAATRSVDASLQEKSLYKLGWAFFQQKQFEEATAQFVKQSKDFPNGALVVDALFMIAECSLKREKYADAWPQYDAARRVAESTKNQVNPQVKALIYLHGAQSARELKKWKEVETWIDTLNTKVPNSQYEPVAKYELAYARQNLKKNDEALELYREVAEEQRNEIGARSRFMMGEVLFANRDFAKAIAEFQKVMYGFGGTQAPDDVKNWQARSAFEAGRCSEVLIGDQTGDRRKKSVETAKKFYEFVVSNHADHSLAQQAKDRINELSK